MLDNGIMTHVKPFCYWQDWTTMTVVRRITTWSAVPLFYNDLMIFYNNLPHSLRLKLLFCIYKKTINTVDTWNGWNNRLFQLVCYARIHAVTATMKHTSWFCTSCSVWFVFHTKFLCQKLWLLFNVLSPIFPIKSITILKKNTFSQYYA